MFFSLGQLYWSTDQGTGGHIWLETLQTEIVDKARYDISHHFQLRNARWIILIYHRSSTVVGKHDTFENEGLSGPRALTTHTRLVFFYRHGTHLSQYIYQSADQVLSHFIQAKKCLTK